MYFENNAHRMTIGGQKYRGWQHNMCYSTNIKIGCTLK